jgi:hypothetical protein
MQSKEDLFNESLVSGRTYCARHCYTDHQFWGLILAGGPAGRYFGPAWWRLPQKLSTGQMLPYADQHRQSALPLKQQKAAPSGAAFIVETDTRSDQIAAFTDSSR